MMFCSFYLDTFFIGLGGDLLGHEAAAAEHDEEALGEGEHAGHAVFGEGTLTFWGGREGGGVDLDDVTDAVDEEAGELAGGLVGVRRGVGHALELGSAFEDDAPGLGGAGGGGGAGDGGEVETGEDLAAEVDEAAHDGWGAVDGSELGGAEDFAHPADIDAEHLMAGAEGDESL